MKTFYSDLYSKRHLLLELSLRSFKNSYTGSTLGLAWVFIEPLIYMGIMYTFFTRAARYTPATHQPYLPWLMCSMVVWYFFSSAIQSSLHVFSAHSFFLKQWKFNMSILCVVPIVSSLLVHLVFLLILFLVFILSHIPFTMYSLQFLYYLFSLCILLVSASWAIGSICLFFKDMRNLTNVLLQLGFWISPIFWEIESFPKKYHFLIKLNPLFYIMMGYRNSFLYQVPFWKDIHGMIYYWSFTLFCLMLGYRIYSKLRPDFGNVV